MNEATFWRLLDQLDWRYQGDDDRVVAPAVQALARLPLREIEAFQQMLARKLHALDGRAWARHIGTGWWGGTNPVSVDEFLYARCAALTNGRERYEAVLADPSRMPKDVEFEALLSIAPKAWEAKTGRQADIATDVSYETYANMAGWAPADPEPAVPHTPRTHGATGKTVKYDYGKTATRRIIRALVTGEVRDPILSRHLAETGRALVMTPGSAVEPPRAPEQERPRGEPMPSWHAAVELWTANAGGDDRRPSGLVARIELQQLSPGEVSVRFLGVEQQPSPGSQPEGGSVRGVSGE